MQLINVDLLRNPYNWLIVYLMVAMGLLLFALVDPLKHATIDPADALDNN